MDLLKIRRELSLGVPLSNLNLRVTFYSRVSTEHVEQIKSLNNQSEYFYEYINSISNWRYFPGYVDEGITGTSDIKRENFMRMIGDAKNDMFDLIITKEISRFSRNTLDSIKYTRELLNSGVAVLFLNDNINTIFSDSELRLTIMASMAQDEIRRLSERVKFGMNRSIKKGVLLGNDLLYGYKKNKDGNLEIVEEEANVVRMIYDLYFNSYNFTFIRDWLNKQNTKTKLNKEWNITTVKRILTNPKYKGYYCAHKSEVIDYMTKKVHYYKNNEWIMYSDIKRIPPIIDEKTWNYVNKIINESSKKTVSNKYLFSEKIFCKEDNSIFLRRKVRRIINDSTWMCSNYLQNGKKSCNSPNMRESELRVILNDLLYQLNINYDEILDKMNKCYLKQINFISSDYELIYNKLISLIIKRIEVSKIELNKYHLNLDMYLNLDININIKNKSFEFKRGYDTNNTKKYIIKYEVNYFYNN